MLEARKIKGYKGYLVSPEGEVISVARTIKHKHNGFYRIRSRILKKNNNTHGYHKVNLSVENKVSQLLVHRLVAKAFIPNPKNKPEINHKNGVRNDNRVENLEWVTRWENERHARMTWGKNLSCS